MNSNSLINESDALFDDPKGTFETVEPGKYLAKLDRIERMSDGEFGPRRKWVFHLADPATGTVIYRADGERHEFPVVTSTKLGPKATARMLAQGLLGRELTDDDTGAALASEILGKRAIALIGPNGNNWVTILSLAPAPEKGKASAKPAASAAVAVLDEDLPAAEPASADLL